MLQLFSNQNVTQIASKIFDTQFSFTDHLKRKIVNKTTCKISKSSPNVSILESFSTVIISLLRLSGFPDLFAKVFLINLKCS